MSYANIDDHYHFPQYFQNFVHGRKKYRGACIHACNIREANYYHTYMSIKLPLCSRRNEYDIYMKVTDNSMSSCPQNVYAMQADGNAENNVILNDGEPRDINYNQQAAN